MMAGQLNLQNVYSLFNEGFTEEQLCCFCYDMPGFIAVYDQLDPNANKAQIIQLLIEHATQTSQFETLLNAVNAYTPIKYKEYQPYFDASPNAVTSDSAHKRGHSTNTVLDRWWKERGYIANPFVWSNAADVNASQLPEFFSSGGNDLTEFFQSSQIDPEKPADFQGLGDTPTLDRIKSLETSELVLIYASKGSGKTFYRRWAAGQIEGERGSAHFLEISNLAARIKKPEKITARDLACCIYEQLCQKFPDQSYSKPAGHVARILAQCDDIITSSRSESPGNPRLYVFIDDIDQLLDEQRTAIEQNGQAFKAMVDFCKIASKRGGGEPLALRIFIPVALKKPIQEYLGSNRHKCQEHTISWGAEHCLAIIERRLDNYWKDGPNTGLNHISRFLAPDAHDEFRKWLERQKHISPRCIIELFYKLGDYAHGHDVVTDLINAGLWNAFSKSNEGKNSCTPDIIYPLNKPRRFTWLKFLMQLPFSFVKQGLAWGTSVGNWLNRIIARLADINDWLGGFILLIVILGSVLFVFWCLWTSAQLNQPASLPKCLQQVWQLVRQYLPGIS